MSKAVLKFIRLSPTKARLIAREVIVSSCRVDAGPVLKRFRPRARGSASGIRKPTSHVMVEVSESAKKED